jgi:lysophospholipase L1-like esterase
VVPSPALQEVPVPRRLAVPFLAALALLVTPATATATTPSGQGQANATGWYLALGDSLAAGYQPGQGDDPTGGYVGHVRDALQQSAAKTSLVNLACSGETSASMIEGGRCAYDEGSQLAQAVEFLHAHARFTRLVTIDIGANDVARCGAQGLPPACVQGGLASVAANLPVILGRLRAAAPGVQVVVLNYYDPFLAAWLTGPAGQALAQQSVALLGTLNAIIAGATGAVGGSVADVASDFHSTDFSLVDVPSLGGLVPRNVATVCALTWMCQRGDIHANDDGYAVLAAAVVARL